eukprot:1137111-Pelagomonas_calceolata.AAC.4
MRCSSAWAWCAKRTDHVSPWPGCVTVAVGLWLWSSIGTKGPDRAASAASVLSSLLTCMRAAATGHGAPWKWWCPPQTGHTVPGEDEEWGLEQV